jgi:hypothetical protein
MVSSKGMRRVVLGEGALHVFLGESGCVVQVRSPHLTSDVDCVGPACKVGTMLGPDETFMLCAELMSCCAKMARASMKKDKPKGKSA